MPGRHVVVKDVCLMWSWRCPPLRYYKLPRFVVRMDAAALVASDPLPFFEGAANLLGVCQLGLSALGPSGRNWLGCSLLVLMYAGSASRRLYRVALC